jgi:hypothetical protein
VVVWLSIQGFRICRDGTGKVAGLEVLIAFAANSRGNTSHNQTVAQPFGEKHVD